MSSFCVSKPMLSFQECLSITDIWTEFPIGSDSEDFKVKQRYSISFLALTPAPAPGLLGMQRGESRNRIAVAMCNSSCRVWPILPKIHADR